MRNLFLTVVFIFSICHLSFSEDHNSYLHHKLNVSFDISKSKLFVIDTIKIPQNSSELSFYLNPNLSIIESNFEIKPLDEKKFGNSIYTVNSFEGDQLIVKYEGVINHNIEKFATARGKYEGSNGIIFDKGIYLSGSTYWVPSFDEHELFTFEMTTAVDEGWKVVSQGEMTKMSDGQMKYTSVHPGIQVVLTANQWTMYERTIAGKNIRVFLLKPDEDIAQRYLGVTSKYMMMYHQLIGAYPYQKFDVVENFWESGYGMPSLTLLGQQVIRFPWILASSYPHEYLHNYWANSVFVDYSQGNWCEGLTTYIADYLLKEQKGQGAVYRRDMLKKYSDYVTTENDFPVNKFRTKTDEASDAIGYAKVLMVNHMLRNKVGTENFIKAYKDFYKNHLFQKASFASIQKSFEKISGKDLQAFFAQWIDGVGAPKIDIQNISVKRKKKQYHLSLELTKKMLASDFEIELPVYVYLKDSKTVVKELVFLKNEIEKINLVFNEEPVRVDVDPYFDVMRRLDKKEVPPTFSQMFGEKEWIIVLPKNDAFYQTYKILAETWKKMYARRGKVIQVIDDCETIEELSNKNVWLFGKENAMNQLTSISSIYTNKLGAKLSEKLMQANNEGVLVHAVFNPEYPGLKIVSLSVSQQQDIMKLSRKLMHYGSKSYVGFESNSLKKLIDGVFPVLDSPLSKILVKDGKISWDEFKLPERDVLFQ